MSVARSEVSASRNYPPLLAAALAMLLLLAVLPSALNLPQTSPAETLEYAPVPPEDQDDITPPSGNFSSLGLGESSNLTRQPLVPEPGGTAGMIGGRAVKTPSTKRCVGNPPRQTEDPLSPPCVASFTGDNGGATYQGVEADEVRILVAVEGGYIDAGSRGTIQRPTARCFDLAAESGYSAQEEPYHFDALRLWQRFFNERYQTYGRFAHFFLCYTHGTGPSSEQQRARAIDDYRAIKPFAAIVHDHPNGNGIPYAEVMASKGVFVFGVQQQRSADFFRRFPRLVWSFLPSVEESVRQFTDWACTKVVGHPVSFAGNDADPDTRLHNGQPRRIGILHTDDDNFPAMVRFAQLAEPRLRECGATIVAKVVNPSACCVGPSVGGVYEANIATLKNEGVTTVIWLQGFDINHSRRATQLNYFPEWVLAGDGRLEDLAVSKQQDQEQWSHAWVWSNTTLFTGQSQEPCFLAAREADPEMLINDSAIPCRLYDDLRQLFTGIQVAGPKLHPDSLDKGFHAIPGNKSSSPKVPACFYLPGDFTCVKDGIAMWWDAEAESPYSSVPGCYRAVDGGGRFLVGGWPPGDVLTQKDPTSDPCSGWASGTFFDPAPGTESRPLQ